jgi:tetratricopeptide (TPR) repeat protein
MCRRRAERRPGGRTRARAARALLACLYFGLPVVLPARADAQAVSSPQATGVEMTAAVREALDRIEEDWLQWMSAFSGGHRQKASQAIDGLLATARELDMARLPDLSFGALAQAVQAARQQRFEQAHWALDAAERLDPGRPETAFAATAVARLEGDWPGAVAGFARAWPRLFGLPLERYLWLQDLLVWILTLLLVTGGLFIAVQMATQGRALFADLMGLFGRRLPRPVATTLAVLLLVWPLALPYGPLWLTLYASLLLWGYGSRSERAVLIAVWLLAGVTPLLLAEQQRRVTLTLSPPVRAMQSLEQRRLYGELFTDLGVLRSRLPDSPAVEHLLADVHRSLGQWELARALYGRVLDQEPANTAALLNLGAYYYLKGDFGGAIDHFRKAAAADARSAAAHFNLSQAYSESYLFDEMKASLAQAKTIDSARVDDWIRGADQQRIVTANGGLARIPAIRRELLARNAPQEAASSRLAVLRRGLSVGLSAGLVLLAVALHLARRPFGYAALPAAAVARGRFGRWGRVLLPGLSAAEAGEGGKGFLALLVVAALLMLPLFGVLGYRIPWGYDPGHLASWIAAILGLLLYLGARLRWELRNEV